ncbi:hypothetical protein BRARA_I01456 [Brassica rapa]|uniref:TIR domain-containing protein n=1 Tax=Brassica campestris TaxID=3711 RepID=A0A397Y2B6_BRACM|nr:hypothetical protein BRARA_I01456 [Brassica rapa]
MSLMATSSSSSLPHVVFPSFHGPDVRSGILSHLRNVFARKGITMFNDNDIERGHTIGSKLVEAITKAEVSIVLLSKNYASSMWCLGELLEILKCKEASELIVIPIFYDVDPSDVRIQTGDFGIAFKKTCSEGVTEKQKQRWIQALTRVANIAGEHLRIWTDEAAMLEKISSDVLKQLKVKKLWEEFRIRDVDQNHYITVQELHYAMTKDGGKVTDEEVRSIIKAADLDYDGRINYDEFVKFMDKDIIEKVVMIGNFPTDVTLEWEEKKEMNHTYRRIDADQKGYITAADYQKYVFTVSERMITDEEAANFIKNFDVDGNGRVYYDEFVKLTR